MALDTDYVCDLLLSVGKITDEQAEETRQKAGDGSVDVLGALEALGFATEEETLATLASEYGMETFDLGNYSLSDDVVQAITPEVAQRYKIIPLMRYDTSLTVGISDPTDIETLDSLRYILKTDIEAMVCKQSDITRALGIYYGSTEESVESFIADVTSGDVDVTGQHEEMLAGGDMDRVAEADSDAPIIRLVSLILIEAYRSRASDIHLEPLEKRFRVRYRIDGVLKEVENPPKYLQNNIISRVKIMSRLDIAEKRIPQDGRILFKMPGKQIDLRVSDLPTVHGESIVMRILDKSSIQLGIPELGFFDDDQQLIENILAMPDGIFLVTGPTGSGKTTSLYAFLNTINTPNRKIITAEDPVEYELSGINQVQCDASIGMTFARALRAMLRQAPNVVMVGEIRDIETGEIAINAALTGHLVFSTLHTNDAPTAITRLIDMGVKPFLVASAVRAIMAQRLLRRICKACGATIEATENELKSLELPTDFFADADLKQGKGCQECVRGYRGRLGIYEIFMIEQSIVKLIFDLASAEIIKLRARELGMRTLRDDGLRKAGAGVTTLEEVIRITKADEEEE
ncbi:MAG: GspE/PulE family protein [Lentisphaeria bacterium]